MALLKARKFGKIAAQPLTLIYIISIDNAGISGQPEGATPGQPTGNPGAWQGICSKGMPHTRGIRALLLFWQNTPGPYPRDLQPCDRCKGLCTGHYLKPNDHAEFVARSGTEKCVFVPPKDQLESAAKLRFEKNEEWTQADYENIAKSVLLSTEDARIWVEHVGLTSERRKAGAKKAAETRARKRQDCQGKITYQEPVAVAVL